MVHNSVLLFVRFLFDISSPGLSFEAFHVASDHHISTYSREHRLNSPRYFLTGRPVRELATRRRHCDRKTRQNYPESAGLKQAPPLAALAVAERSYGVEWRGHRFGSHQDRAWPDDWQRRGTLHIRLPFEISEDVESCYA